MTDQERLELMLEYVAGTLDAPQTESVRQALLRGDPAWSAALAEAEATLAAYAGAIQPIAPPVSAKSDLMQRIAREQATGRVAGPSAPADGFGSMTRFAQGFAAIAAIILVAVLVNFWTNKKIDAARNEVQVAMDKELRDRDAKILILQTVMDKQIKEKDQQLVAYQAAMEHDGRVLAALHSPNLKIVTLGSDKTKATGRLLIDEDKATLHLFATSLAPLPADKTYELWFITPDSQKIAGGTFNVDANGNATYTVALPKGIGPVAVAAVTDEVAGGVAVPAGSIQLVGKLN